MSSRAWGWGLLVLVACSRTSAPPSTDPEPPAVVAEVTEPAPAEPLRCESAACLVELAQRARDAGMLDVASGHLGAAYRLEPTEKAMVAWVEALQRAGRHREAARALEAAAERHGAVVGALRTMAMAPGSDRPLDVATPSAALAEALRAEAEGRPRDAIEVLDGATEPAALARLGDLWWQAGDPVPARRAWARARVELEERGATLRVAPVRRWYTDGVFWADDQLALLHSWRPVEQGDPVQVSELRRLTLGASPQVRRSVVLPGDTASVTPTADGRALVRASSQGLQIVDLSTGRATSELGSVDGRVSTIASAGTGESLVVLLAMAERSELRAADGEVLDTYVLQGTTPTITRVYRAGQGTRHDNILRDSPTWPVSAAVSSDARWVAIGGSDSKVRLFDRTRGTERELAYEWSYEERRHRGGNPDLNLPLHMVFAKGGEQLVVVYRHGDVIRWTTRNGRRAKVVPGPCTLEEATAAVNRFVEPGEPRQVPTDEQRTGCGYAPHGLLSADGQTVVTSGSLDAGVRIRDATTGRALAMLLDTDMPDALLALSPTGVLALTNIYGRPWVWSRDDGLQAPFGRTEPSTGPIDARLSADGRYLSFDLRARWVVWDLHEGRDVSPSQGPGEYVRGVAPDGSRIMAWSDDALELRTREGEVEWSRPTNDTEATFSPDGALAVLSEYEGPMRLRNLATGKEVELRRSGENRRVVFSADGTRVAVFGYGGPLEVLDAATGARVLDTGATTDVAALAPDGSWVAWLEQGERPEQGLPEATAHLQRIGRRPGRPRTMTITGWAKELVPSPHGEELLVVTESAIARFWVHDGKHHEIPDVGYVWPNQIQYSPDGRQLFFQGYERLEIRDNDDALSLVATIYPQLDGGWSIMSAAGAVDGSDTAPEHFMTVAEGASDRFVHGGTLGWDRFAADNLFLRAREGEVVQPPIEAAPRPVLR